MSRDKQIEEMAKCCPFLKNGKCQGDSPLETDCDLMCKMFGFITNLIQDGYRKASEVAREIFEEIEKEIEEALKSNYKVLPRLEISNELYNSVRGKIDALRGIEGFLAELKKKYTEEGK